jgi:hypothetical protein
MPFPSCLFLKIHLVPNDITKSLGLSTRVHTLLRLKLLSSSCMAIRQSESSSASYTFLGSTQETKAWWELNLDSCLLLETPLRTLPTTFAKRCSKSVLNLLLTTSASFLRSF